MRRAAKQIVTVVCAVGLFLGCGAMLNYILVDDTPSESSAMARARLMFHEMYTSDNIDIVFLGSSHASVSFVPKIVDEKMNAHAFNAGTASQAMDGSFAVLQELCMYHKPRHVFLEMFYSPANGPEYNERTNLLRTYHISDYMRLSFRKLDYLLHAGNKKHYVNDLFPARRNWKKIFDINYILSTIKNKQSPIYKNYRWKRKDGDQIYYVERGLIAIDRTWQGGWSKNGYGEIGKAVQLTEKNDWYKSLLQIISYCKINGIELSLVMAPMPEMTIVGKGNYQLYHDFIQDIADTHGLLFDDFNFCRPDYLNLNDRILFADDNHLNPLGAERFTELFSDYVMGKISKENLFYETLQDKLSAEEPNVFGFAGLTKEGKGYVISNREHGMEYRLEARPKEGEPRVIQDYSEGKDFIIPKDEHGKLVLLWRTKGLSAEGIIETEY